MKNAFATVPVVGIVCEYDPFHRGHARQIAQIRARLPGAAIVCVMSGPFTQRGAAALFSPAFRAERALCAGADAVLELPCLFAVREAEHFALGGVSILQQLGFVTHISFGCEAEDLAPLRQAAELMEREPDRFRAAVREAQRDGRSYAAAQGAALAALLPSADASAFALPNNILAISYLRAVIRLGAALEPLPVRREGDYHARELPGAGVAGIATCTPVEHVGAEARVPAERAGAQARVLAERTDAEARVLAERAGTEARAPLERTSTQARVLAECAGAEARVLAEGTGAEARAPLERTSTQARVLAEGTGAEVRVPMERASAEARVLAERTAAAHPGTGAAGCLRPASSLPDTLPGAGAVRAAYLSGDRTGADAACGYSLPDEPVCRPDALDAALLYRLRGMSADRLAALPDCTEGLENRLYAAAREATDRGELLALLKTKRYAYARLSRLVCHALLDMPQALLDDIPLPPYARLLGLRKSSNAVLRGLAQTGLPIVSKPADGPTADPCYRLDERAYDLWALGAGLPAGLMYRAPVFTLD